MADAVLLERSGPVASLVLNRPDKHNALRFADLDRLVALLHEAEDDDEVRSSCCGAKARRSAPGTTTTTRPVLRAGTRRRPARNPAVPASGRRLATDRGSG